MYCVLYVMYWLYGIVLLFGCGGDSAAIVVVEAITAAVA